MRVAALYDVHGMGHALDAVLVEVERARVDAIVIGGDLAAGPFPRETLARVRGLDARCIRGNGDRRDFESPGAGCWPDAEDFARENLAGGVPRGDALEAFAERS